MQEYRTTDFRIKVRKSVVLIYCSAWFLVSLFPLLPNKTGAEICPLSGQISVPVFPVRAGAHPSCWNRMDSHCTNRWGIQRSAVTLALGHPIGASSIPVGKGSPEGNSVPLGGRFPKEGSAFLGTRLSLGKSSVLYLCFRLTPGRGWLQHLQSEPMTVDRRFPVAVGQADFCTTMDEIRICTAGKIRLTGKGSKGISTPVPPQRQRPR